MQANILRKYKAIHTDFDYAVEYNEMDKEVKREILQRLSHKYFMSERSIRKVLKIKSDTLVEKVKDNPNQIKLF